DANRGLRFNRCLRFRDKRSLAGQINPSLVVDLRYLHRNLIAKRHDILHLSHPFCGQLRDMYQTFLAWQHFYEAAELLDPLDGTEIHLAYHNFLDNVLDQLTRLTDHLFIRRSDEYAAV